MNETAGVFHVAEGSSLYHVVLSCYTTGDGRSLAYRELLL